MPLDLRASFVSCLLKTVCKWSLVFVRTIFALHYRLVVVDAARLVTVAAVVVVVCAGAGAAAWEV